VLRLVEQAWTNRTIHDTVGAIVRDRAYQRSILGSLLGRALMAVVNGIAKLLDLVKRIPGGRLTVIGVVLAIVALIVARIVLSADWRNDDLIRRRQTGARTLRTDPWSEAERLAAAGDYTGAAHALYQAVLRRLAGSERISVHASKTSGDYSRELRRRGSPAATAFQQFGRRFDRVIFGIGECSPQEFDAMLREAMAITPRQAA
jgi:hypothetical protein